MNDYQKRRFAANMVRKMYNTVSGKKIAMLGWTFKKDTNDTRESAANYVADYLLNEQAEIVVYDPKLTEEQIYSDLDYLKSRSDDANREAITVVNDPMEACEDAHAIAVLTEWDEFKELGWKQVYDKMLKPAFLFDGRRLLEPSTQNVRSVLNIIPLEIRH